MKHALWTLKNQQFSVDLHAQICESRSKQVYEPFDRKMNMFFDTAHVVVENNPVINKAYKVAAYQLWVRLQLHWEGDITPVVHL